MRHMKVDGHYIRDAEIIGIGPLLMEQSSDNVMRSLYNATRLTFLVHCRQQSIRIESEWFKIGHRGDSDDKTIKERSRYDHYMVSYNDIQQQIISLPKQ